MYKYMYIYVYIYIYMYIYIFVHIYICMYIHSCIDVYMYIYICIHHASSDEYIYTCLRFSDKPSGFGVENYPDGSSYIGQYEEDMRHGYGIATHCNTLILQHTATHCFGCHMSGRIKKICIMAMVLQHTATHQYCNTPKHTATH